MSEILIVDLGASRIKSALYVADGLVFLDAEECASPSLESSSELNNIFEIPVEKYWEGLLNTAGEIIRRNPGKNIKSLWICSEMHGFVLADLKGIAKTPYISWKDQRAIFDGGDGESTFSKLNLKLTSFKSITGMNLKPGLPILTLASGVCNGTIPELKNIKKNEKVRVLSLVDWLLYRGGELDPKSNITLAAGLGIYDLKKQTISQEIIGSEYLAPLKISNLDIQKDISKPLGKIKIHNLEISVFGGIGDLQAAIQGGGYRRIAMQY